MRCLSPAQPLPDDGGPYGAARRARRASPSTTTVLVSRLSRLPVSRCRGTLRALRVHAGCDKRRSTARGAALANARCGAAVRSLLALEQGEAWHRARLTRRPSRSCRLMHHGRRTDLQGRPRTPRGPSTAVWSIAPFSPPRTSQSRCGATLRALRVDRAGTTRRRNPILASLSRSCQFYSEQRYAAPEPVGRVSTHSASS